MENQNQPGAPKSSWGKRIGLILGVLVLLLVVLYFVGTSSAFIKAMVLPKVGKALNAKVTAGDISVSPFSQVHIRKLNVVTTGAEPLLAAEEVRLRYSLMKILGGNINVDEVTISSPVVTIVQEADGTSNLDPLLKSDGKDDSKESGPSESAKVSIRNVALKNGIVRQIQKTKEGGLNTTTLDNINITLDQLGNGQTGKLNLAAGFSMDQQAGATNSALGGEISGGYDIGLNQQLLPEVLKGSTRVAVSRTTGRFSDLAGFSSSLDADLTPKEIRQVALRFAKGNQQLGVARISGPLDLEKKEGNLKVELVSLDKNALALATAGKGYDFRNSTINSTNQITISQQGTFFAANGNLAGSKISVAQQAMVTPEIDLNVLYQVTVNTSDKSALIDKFNVTGSSNGKEFLLTTLDQQMNLSWGETVKGYKDAAMRMILTNFNLADWRAVLGTNIHAGFVNAGVGIVSQKDGRLLKMDISANIANLSAQFGSNRLANGTVGLQTAGTVEDLKVVNLERYSATLAQNNEPVFKANGAARYNTATKEATAQLTGEGTLPRLLTLLVIPDTQASSGQLKISANYTDAGGKLQTTGNVGIESFTGKYGDYAFTNFQTGFEYNAEMENQILDIHRASATFAQGFNKGGSIDLKGRYNLDKESGQFTFKTVDLNQNTFGPILTPSLGDNRLVSISLNASGDASLDPQAESTVKAEAKVSNWVVQNKEGTMPKTPLAVDVKVDGGIRKEVLDLRQLLVQLTPTERAKNALLAQGKLDLSKSNASPSTLSLRSESLDVTPYYNIFAGDSKVDATAKPQSPQTSAAEKEPEPMNLPFQQLAAEFKFDRLYLRQIAITNWVGNLTIRSNVVELNPFKLEMNGGPVSMTGNFDVGQPGYRYDLGFKAENVPLAPLANSLELVSSNQLQGTFIADARLRGVGLTGPNLRANLGGNIDLNLTNINYVVGGPKLRRIMVPMSIALRAPELAQTPLNWASVRAQIGNGIVRVENAAVESEAFFATLAGTVTLDNVISNSTYSLPINFHLRRSLAEKARVLPGNTPPEAKFAELGNIYTLKGTVGAPDVDENKAVLAGLLIRSAAGFGLGNEKAEKALGSLGNILSGQGGASTNAASTNSAGAGGLLQGLGGLLGKDQKAATNTSGGAKTSSTNASTNNQPAKSNPLGDLLRSLPGTKQQ